MLHSSVMPAPRNPLPHTTTRMILFGAYDGAERPRHRRAHHETVHLIDMPRPPQSEPRRPTARHRTCQPRLGIRPNRPATAHRARRNPIVTRTIAYPLSPALTRCPSDAYAPLPGTIRLSQASAERSALRRNPVNASSRLVSCSHY